MTKNEEKYIKKRIWKARFQSIFFYLCRLFPINQRKIVFCCIEGTTGYTCNPKYIAKELIDYNEKIEGKDKFRLIWLVNDVSKEFPREIKVVKNTLLNRAYQLTTAGVWIDNSRKQLEVRKRKGQLYIQTWHARLGFKPTCLDRGTSFSKIAYLVSRHDSDMVDYWLSNSDWYDQSLPTGSLYDGRILRTGSPRCDILVKASEDTTYKEKLRQKLINRFGLQEDEQVRFFMYAPTFRGGSQGTERKIMAKQGFTDYDALLDGLGNRFGGKWVIILRLHPQLVVHNLDECIVSTGGVVDASRVDDMYELLAGCDAFMTDYSSAAFDAAVMKIPVFLYADDYEEYESERGHLLWDLRKLPFPLACNSKELIEKLLEFNDNEYQKKLQKLLDETGMSEDGRASAAVVKNIIQLLRMGEQALKER